MITKNTSVHYMQTRAWADIKAAFGWKSDIVELGHANIVVYKRSVPGVGKLVYIPGATTTNPDGLTEVLRKRYAKKAFAARLELNQLYDERLVSRYEALGWRSIQKHVQYRHTVTVDLSQPEDDIWMSFKSRGRYEVLQAQKAGVIIEQAEPTADNLKKMYELMQVTSARNKFFIRDTKFTMAYWYKFAADNNLKLFFATHEGDVLAGAIVLISGKLAWYKDGGSVRIKSNLMAPRLMQWEIMKALKQEGINTYDLGGIPAPENHKDSSMHGIYVFKSAYSKETVTLMPTLELPLSARYALWPKAEKQWLRVYNLFAHNLWW